MGPYPFGNLGIQPKMRSGRRFENQNQRLQPCTAPNCKNQFSKRIDLPKYKIKILEHVFVHSGLFIEA